MMINFPDIHELQRLVLLEYGCDFLMIFQLIVYEVLKSFNFQMRLLSSVAFLLVLLRKELVCSLSSLSKRNELIFTGDTGSVLSKANVGLNFFRSFVCQNKENTKNTFKTRYLSFGLRNAKECSMTHSYGQSKMYNLAKYLKNLLL